MADGQWGGSPDVRMPGVGMLWCRYGIDRQITPGSLRIARWELHRLRETVSLQRENTPLLLLTVICHVNSLSVLRFSTGKSGSDFIMIRRDILHPHPRISPDNAVAHPRRSVQIR